MGRCRFCSDKLTLPYILCATCSPSVSICLPCFSHGTSNATHKATHPYRLIHTNLPLTDPSWTAAQDTKLLSGVERYGTNWELVASHFPDKTMEMCERHFYTSFIDYPIHPSLDLHRNAKYNTIKPGETASEGLTERLRGIPRIVVEAKRGDWEVRYNNSAEEDFMAGERGEEIVDKLQIGIMWKYRNTLKRRRLLENLYYEYGNMLLDTPPPSNPLDPPPKMAPIELSPEEEFPIQTVLKLARFLTKEKVETLQRNFDRVNQLKGEIKQLQKLRRDGIKTNFGVAVHDKLARDRDKTKPYSHTKRVRDVFYNNNLSMNTRRNNVRMWMRAVTGTTWSSTCG
eukprot:sb/3466412/